MMWVLGVAAIYALPNATEASISEINMLRDAPVATYAPTLTTGMGDIIPMPVSVNPDGGRFTLLAGAQIYVEPSMPEIMNIGHYLADKLNPATGYGIQVSPTTGTPANGNIYLTTAGGDSALGEEGYQLTITPDLVRLVAYEPAGLFRGIQTIRQLLSPTIESASVQPGPWNIATGMIRDYPRFAWRGVMLDVARHFFKVDDVKRYMDYLAFYKINRFHLHLSDDQGWRIVINAWPKLATIGGSAEVGGSGGGYYTQADYADIVAYAQSRYITVVPEIDMPGHTNAALASYASLNCNGVAPALYTGIEVGFSSLCTNQDATYSFVSDVIKELSALTPGPYIHIGGDESSATNSDDYIHFVERVEAIVQSDGKQVIGWEEIARGSLPPTAIVQHWNPQGSLAQKAVAQGAKVVMSPASKAYMDMKYDPSTTLGLAWAGYIEVRDAYNWDPATIVSGVSEADIMGVEAPLWSETLVTLDDIEYMAFPRVLGYAEIGWSPANGRNWDEYKLRLAAHGPRLTALGVKFYPSTLVPWR